ncbi:UNVERIFIED_CONTAM: hypothetical protein HDU68_003102 [Siphonaria sp. JEL0065]|nr:hypothetical protein HDU68_003102 [Siphonaria sp. JEL0065]
MSIQTGVLNRNTHYFNGTDFLCEELKDDIVVNPVVVNLYEPHDSAHNSPHHSHILLSKMLPPDIILRALEFIPNSVKIWKAAISLEEVQKTPESSSPELLNASHSLPNSGWPSPV